MHGDRWLSGYLSILFSQYIFPAINIILEITCHLLLGGEKRIIRFVACMMIWYAFVERVFSGGPRNSGK